MDPYKSPQIVDETKEPSAAEAPTPRRTFRWRVIPASLCWLFGGVTLLVVPFAVVNNWKYLSVNWADSLPWILLDIASLAKFPSMIGFSVALLYAGNHWMKGRWVFAIAFSIIPWLLMMALKETTEYLEAWAMSLS